MAQAVEHIKSAGGPRAHLMVTFEDTRKNPNLCRFYQSMAFKNRKDDRGGYFSLAPLRDEYARTVLTAPKGSVVCNTNDGLTVQDAPKKQQGSRGIDQEDEEGRKEEEEEAVEGQQGGDTIFSAPPSEEQ